MHRAPRRPRLAALVLGAVLAGAGAVLADAPLEALRPGLAGVAVTAGPGDELVRFPVTVLGLLEDAGDGFPLVLVRAGGPFIEASGGVAAGMSGSPVYVEIDGREELVGAIGYVFPDADHELALVTPIAAMREDARVAAPPHGAVAVRTPLLLGGLGPRAASLLTAAFADAPTEPLPVQAGAAGRTEAAFELVPGAAVSVQLLRGDVTAAAVGTVTAVEDGRVLAFGHPLLNRGEVSYPLAPAHVAAIVPSRVVPFKLANVGREAFGAITQDRPAALGGRVGAEAAMLPVAIRLGGEAGERGARIEVVRDERLYPALVAAAALQLLDEGRRRVAGGSAELAWEITLADGSTVRVLEQVADRDDLARAAARLAGAPLALLADNPFEPAEVERVAIRIETDAEVGSAEIVDVELEPGPVAPGGVATAYVRLQPFRGEPQVRTVRFELPAELGGRGEEPDALEVTVRGGGAGGDEGDDDARDPPILSYGELLVALRDREQASELVVETVVDGRRRRLARLPLPWVVEGLERVTVPLTAPGGTAEGTEGP